MIRHIESAPERRTVLSALGVYAERPALVMVALGFSGEPAVLPDLRHAVGVVSRRRPLARGDRLLQPGHARLDLQVPVGAVHRPRTCAGAPRLAGAPPVVDARVSGPDHARALARRPVRSHAQPRNDCGLCGAGRLLIGHAGHRHGCLAHRGGGDVQAGRDGRRLSVGLPRRHDRRGRGAAAPGPGRTAGIFPTA